MSMGKRLGAEFFGTFWLVFGGCGSAIFAAAFPDLGIGFAGVALAFGLTVVTMAYAVGHISGAHFNPAVTLGMCVAGRLPAKDVVPYWIAQIIGGLAAGAALYCIATGKPGFDAAASGFASNGYGDHSPSAIWQNGALVTTGYSLHACMIAEFLLTAFFILVISGTTHKLAPTGFAPLAIGLTLTLIHLISIPITNTSVNPARSLGVAVFQGGWALQQVWMFLLIPLIGAAVGGVIHRAMFEKTD
jgi:aquaporin Z